MVMLWLMEVGGWARKSVGHLAVGSFDGSATYLIAGSGKNACVFLDSSTPVTTSSPSRKCHSISSEYTKGDFQLNEHVTAALVSI
jgi:hypothetical protein